MDGQIDEWNSALAYLTLESVNLITNADDLAKLMPQSKILSGSLSPQSSERSSSFKPTATRIYDNLAAHIKWQVNSEELRKAYDEKRPGFLETLKRNDSLPVEFQVQMAKQKRDTSLPAPVSDLLGSSLLSWDEPVIIPDDKRYFVKKNSTCHVYLGKDILEPSENYRFRVIIRDPESANEILPPSDWSDILSFTNMSPVDPPIIVRVKPMSGGRIYVSWRYTGDGTEESRQDDLLSTSEGNQLVNSQGVTRKPSGVIFTPDFFRVLYRPVFKETCPGCTKVVKYGQYGAHDVDGSDSRSTVVEKLNKTANYQILVYAVKGNNDRRINTRFSQPMYANLATADPFADTNNNLLYIILAALAGLMLLILSILIIMCVCRQTQSRKRRRSKQDGLGYGYKDTAKYMHRNEAPGSDQLDANGLPLTSLQQRMTPEQSAQQQAEEYAQSIAQAQAMQQQQQQQQAALLMGSHYHHPAPPHHQSHQSLLVPGAQANHHQHHRQPPTHHQFNSGTLPTGPRYMRQNQYGSQMLSPSQNNGNVMMSEYGHPNQNPQMAYPPSQYLMNPNTGMPMGTSTLNRTGMTSMGCSGQQSAAGGTNSSHYHPPTIGRGEFDPQYNGNGGGMISPSNGGQTFHGSQQAVNMLHHQQQALMNAAASQQNLQSGIPAPPPPNAFQSSNGQHPVGGQHLGGATDAESIYSYFSQQEGMLGAGGMATPGGMHPQLNTLPEENQMAGTGGAYNENGQLSYGNGMMMDPLTNSAAGSPAQGVHRHHRRRRRKHQNSNGANPMVNGQNGGQFDQNQSFDANDQMMNGHAMGDSSFTNQSNTNGSGTNGGMMPAYDGGIPPAMSSAAGINMSLLSNTSSMNNNNTANGGGGVVMSSAAPTSSAASGALPPPNQPPPPPPAFARSAAAANSPSTAPLPNLPRIRDYSEYGIPRAMVQQQQQQTN